MTDESDDRGARPDPGPTRPLASAPPLPESPQVSRRRIALVLLTLLVCVVLAFFAGYLPRRSARKRLEQRAGALENGVPEVTVVRPKRLETDVHLVLPGSIQALHETTLFPQADGYIAKFLVDIGDHAEAGQVLASIETPALDQELDQGRAALAQAEASLGQTVANRDYAHTTLARYAALRPAGVTSQQDLDQRHAEALVSDANVTAARAAIEVQSANLRRLIRLKQFAQVKAPFAGTVTERFIDQGALVTSGSTTPLFRLVAADPVRVFVQVPQDAAPSVQVGAAASLSLREYAGRTFTGVITRTAGALQAATRTLNTEIRVPNPKNELFTGMYTNVTLTLTAPRVVYELPGTALYDDAEGLRVATVDAQSKVHFAHVTLERDLGASVLVASGLAGDEQVIRLTNAGFRQGTRVRTAR